MRKTEVFKLNPAILNGSLKEAIADRAYKYINPDETRRIQIVFHNLALLTLDSNDSARANF